MRPGAGPFVQSLSKWQQQSVNVTRGVPGESPGCQTTGTKSPQSPFGWTSSGPGTQLGRVTWPGCLSPVARRPPHLSIAALITDPMGDRGEAQEEELRNGSVEEEHLFLASFPLTALSGIYEVPTVCLPHSGPRGPAGPTSLGHHCSGAQGVPPGQGIEATAQRGFRRNCPGEEERDGSPGWSTRPGRRSWTGRGRCSQSAGSK